MRLACPNVRQLRTLDLTEAGLVKRVRGTAYSAKLSPQVPNRAATAARAVLNNLIPDVFVFPCSRVPLPPVSLHLRSTSSF